MHGSLGYDAVVISWAWLTGPGTPLQLPPELTCLDSFSVSLASSNASCPASGSCLLSAVQQASV
eukprot:650754-Rhodomonas_salina.1